MFAEDDMGRSLHTLSISVHSAAPQKNTSLPEFLETLCMK